MAEKLETRSELFTSNNVNSSNIDSTKLPGFYYCTSCLGINNKTGVMLVITQHGTIWQISLSTSERRFSINDSWSTWIE